MTAPAVLPGAEAWSHHALDPTDGAAPGALVLHGFTGNPSSMRGLAETLAAEGLHVELPRLPGHGTTIEDMLTTGWADWTAEVEAAHQRLAARAGKVVVAGLSMGGSLALWAALQHPDVAGLVLVNPATKPQPPEVMTMLADMVAAGTDVAPGIGSDIADPDVSESAYDGSPLRPLTSFIDDGLAPMAERYGELTMPLLLFTSPRGPRRRAGPERVPRGALRRARRPPLARAQLPRGDDGLRPRRHQRRRGHLRQAGHRVLT